MLRLILVLLCCLGQSAWAESHIRQIDTQFIAALGAPSDTHGSNAQLWGLWEKDPGPRGVC